MTIGGSDNRFVRRIQQLSRRQPFESVLLLTTGRPDAWYLQGRAKRRRQSWSEALHHIEPWIGPTSAESPIFILACGWRSGSTALQRIVASSNQALIWGEPYAESGIVPRMAEQILPFSQSWPHQRWILSEQPMALDLVRHHSENLYPPPSALVAAHRSFMETLLAEPARHLGYSMWGLKEVRLSAEYGGYLKLLYPRARFVLLVRNPLTSWASYRSEARWFLEWPRQQVRTVIQFGRMWARLARSFLDWQTQLDGLLLRYEDLIGDGPAVRQLMDYLGMTLNPESALNYHTSTTTSRPTASEVRALNLMVRDPARTLGYEL